ncbi:MAG: RtcB family protein, partial [Planctomycetota bacterium]
MKARELKKLGIPPGEIMKTALRAISAAARDGLPKAEIRWTVQSLVEDPRPYAGDEHFGALAEAWIAQRAARKSYAPRAQPAPYRQWGDDLEEQSIQQMRNACRLPVSVRGALMPDAHLGYGLPIGGVLATRNAVIPYAVGVDIACRMKMSVYELPGDAVVERPDRLRRAIETETRFGIGASFRDRRDHPVLDDDWTVSPVTREVKDKAWAQLGTSGSGNHFVEFGVFEVNHRELGLEPGSYLALLSHSGSRGAGATVAGHYSKLAMGRRRELPRELRHLAWLDLDSAEGR